LLRRPSCHPHGPRRPRSADRTSHQHRLCVRYAVRRRQDRPHDQDLERRARAEGPRLVLRFPDREPRESARLYAIQSGMKKRVALIAALVMLASAGAAAETKSPQQYLGFNVGDDYKLAEWQQITGYFRDLAGSSNRVKVDMIGQTTLKKPFLRVTISSP